MTKKVKKPWKKLGPANSAPTITKRAFRVPTKEYEDVFFKSGIAKDVAQFKDTIEQLSKYVNTLGWKQASALANAMTNLKDQALVAPAIPTRT